VEIYARQVGVTGPHGPLLRPTSLRIRTGELTLVAGEPGRGHTALALTLAGQLRPDTGEVLVDGRADRAALLRRVAVVDAPQVTEPDDGLRLAAVVAEELALSGAPAGRRAVAGWLAERDGTRYARDRFLTLPPALRTRLLVELAAARPGNEVLILDCPDRHTDDVQGWWELAQAHAQRKAVVVLCSNSSAQLLGAPAARLGQPNEPVAAAGHPNEPELAATQATTTLEKTP
jgi:ABC-type multidrug transport system ATPase subunit